MDIELTCPLCEKKFSRRRAEYNRSLKEGRNSYCSSLCAGKATFDNIPEDKRLHPENLDAGNRLDEHSPFRFHIRNAKRRGKDCDLTLEYLKALWESQEGRCPYTGWQLKNMPSLTFTKQLPLTPDRASLDRIDSSKGYVVGNVQFVSYMAQCCKNQFSGDDLVGFCQAVVTHKSR